MKTKITIQHSGSNPLHEMPLRNIQCGQAFIGSMFDLDEDLELCGIFLGHEKGIVFLNDPAFSWIYDDEQDDRLVLRDAKEVNLKIITELAE